MKKITIITTAIVATVIGMVSIPTDAKAMPHKSAFIKNVAKLDALADKMVLQARIDMKRNHRRGESPAFRAVSRHADLTNDLVKAAHSNNPYVLKKAAVAVETNLKTMKANRISGNKTPDAISYMIRESLTPAKFVVDNVRNFNLARHSVKPVARPVAKVVKKEPTTLHLVSRFLRATDY